MKFSRRHILGLVFAAVIIGLSFAPAWRGVKSTYTKFDNYRSRYDQVKVTIASGELAQGCPPEFPVLVIITNLSTYRLKSVKFHILMQMPERSTDLDGDQTYVSDFYVDPGHAEMRCWAFAFNGQKPQKEMTYKFDSKTEFHEQGSPLFLEFE